MTEALALFVFLLGSLGVSALHVPPQPERAKATPRRRERER